jgi:hypothetical protein
MLRGLLFDYSRLLSRLNSGHLLKLHPRPLGYRIQVWIFYPL